MNRRVKLTGVQGDQEDFADLIGTEGLLDVKKGGKKVTYLPNGRTDWLTMTRKRLSDKDGVVKVRTTLGNTFTFRLIQAPANAPGS